MSIILKGTILIIALIFVACSSEEQKASFTTSQNITGVVGKGTAIRGKVSVYTANNVLIGEDENIKNGKYSIPNPNNYKGIVKAVAHIYSYKDEMLKQDIEVNNLILNSISSINNNSNIVNITPLTEIATRLIVKDLKELKSVKIANVNKYIAKKSGIPNYNPAKDSLKFINKDDGAINDTSINRNGIVLLSISKDSNLSSFDNNVTVKNKVTNSIDNLYHAIVQSITMGDTSDVENIVEDINNTNVSIIGISNEDIIDSNVSNANSITVDPISEVISKIINYANSNGTSIAPTINDINDTLGLYNVTNEIIISRKYMTSFIFVQNGTAVTFCGS